MDVLTGCDLKILKKFVAFVEFLETSNFVSFNLTPTVIDSWPLAFGFRHALLTVSSLFVYNFALGKRI